MRPGILFRLMGATAIALSILNPAKAGDSSGSTRHGESDEVKISSTAETGFDNVEVLDRSLDGRLSVVSVGSDRTKTNLLSIFATLKNLTSSSLLIEAETLYKDGNGDWMDGGKASWLSLEIKPHAELEYRSASLSEEAQDFLVRIRRPVLQTAVK
jgi:hypothetical protein